MVKNLHISNRTKVMMSWSCWLKLVIFYSETRPLPRWAERPLVKEEFVNTRLTLKKRLQITNGHKTETEITGDLSGGLMKSKLNC